MHHRDGVVPNAQQPSAGLLLLGNVLGHVTNCVMEHNGVTGIVVGEQAQLVTEALRERIATYTEAGLERFILAFPKERAAEMVKRVGELRLN